MFISFINIAKLWVRRNAPIGVRYFDLGKMRPVVGGTF